MKRDSLFYRLFAQSPTLLFDLLPDKPDQAAAYRFDSVAVKEPKFEIDGVFLPPASAKRGIVYFCEVQMQKDQQLYERLFGESLLYFYRNRSRFADWQAVVIYPSRSMEQTDTHPYRALLNSDQVHRIYLDELGEMEALPLGIAAMVLTILQESEVPEKARMLIQRAQEEVSQLPTRQAIIDIVSTIITYKFTNLSRQEIDAMLGTKLEETRVYQDAFREGQESEAQQSLERERSLILRQLIRKVGSVDNHILERIHLLSIEQLESLGEALLDFGQIADLNLWLENHA